MRTASRSTLSPAARELYVGSLADAHALIEAGEKSMFEPSELRARYLADYPKGPPPNPKLTVGMSPEACAGWWLHHCGWRAWERWNGELGARPWLWSHDARVGKLLAHADLAFRFATDPAWWVQEKRR